MITNQIQVPVIFCTPLFCFFAAVAIENACFYLGGCINWLRVLSFVMVFAMSVYIVCVFENSSQSSRLRHTVWSKCLQHLP